MFKLVVMQGRAEGSTVQGALSIDRRPIRVVYFFEFFYIFYILIYFKNKFITRYHVQVSY